MNVYMYNNIVYRIGDETELKSDRKRKNSEQDGPPNKKFKKKDNNNERKKLRQRKPTKYDLNIDEMKNLCEPIYETNPDELIDPITKANINLESENRMKLIKSKILNVNNKKKRNIYHESIKHINQDTIHKILIKHANFNGFNFVDNNNSIKSLISLGLIEYIKNIIQMQNKFKNIRIKDILDKKRYYITNKTDEWIESMNQKEIKKQIVAVQKDTFDSLLNEKADLEFKKLTGSLTDEEIKRKKAIEKKITEFKKNKGKNDGTAMKALGGDFEFSFKKKKNSDNNNGNNNKSGSPKKDYLKSNRLILFDALNALENNRFITQNNVDILYKYYMKQN